MIYMSIHKIQPPSFFDVLKQQLNHSLTRTQDRRDMAMRSNTKRWPLRWHNNIFKHVALGYNNAPSAKDLTITPTTPKTNYDLAVTYIFTPKETPNQALKFDGTRTEH